MLKLLSRIQAQFEGSPGDIFSAAMKAGQEVWVLCGCKLEVSVIKRPEGLKGLMVTDSQILGVFSPPRSRRAKRTNPRPEDKG